jgi:imidazolonepropionase-like amidohydrolase
VVDLGATYNFLKLRETFKTAEFSPTIYMTGPLLTTYQPKVYENLENDAPFSLVTSIENAKKMVQDQLIHKPDFIKIWYIVGNDGLTIDESAKKNLPMVKAIIEEAHINKLKVAVHATERITAQLAVENGCDYLVHSVEDEIVSDEFVKLLKKNRVVLCPTLNVNKGYSSTFAQTKKFSNQELLTSNPFQLGTLFDLKHLPDTLLVNKLKRRLNSKAIIEKREKKESIAFENLKKLSNAGVLIVTGTDAGNIGTLHASSYLSELRAMENSGMNRWQILEASTINGAKLFNKENDFGSIKVGKKASLVLLNANPIDNLENIFSIDKVINKGKFFIPSALVVETPDALVQRQVNAYNQRNIEAFLEPYDDEVEVYTFPDKLRYKGKDKMRKSYAGMFEETPNLHCNVVSRIIKGNVVIDQEKVQFLDEVIKAVAIYHIENNKIKKVYFLK